MSRITALFVGVAALTVISTVAEAEDGCGRGWYHNGRRSLKHGSTARRTSRFRMGCASRIGDVRRFPGLGGRLGWRPKRRFRGEAARCMRRPNSRDRTPGRADPTVGANTGLCTTQRTRGLMPERVRLERIRSLT
jgi:hypothetical protein